MNTDEIRVALETAKHDQQDALLAAVQHAADLAPAVIAVAQSMADGRMPLPREERLLRFCLLALAVARNTKACPVFLMLLRRPAIELEWLFSQDDRIDRVARLLLGLFDGDDAAVCAVAADPEVDGDVRAGLLSALARMSWEGRASREALVDLLDRFDREELAPPSSWAWFGWHEAIMLLGLTDWIERAQRGWDAGRDVPTFEEAVDRDNWIQRVHAAAEHPEDPQRFLDDRLMPFDDPVKDVGWWADPAGGPSDPLSDNETLWLDVALWRRVASESGTKCLEWADGFLAALAVGPVRLPPLEYLPAILGSSETGTLFDSPEHDAYVAELLARKLATARRVLLDGDELEPWITGDLGELRGALWAQGYLAGIEKCKDAWQPLIGQRQLAERLIVPVVVLLPDLDEIAGTNLSPGRRWELIRELPEFLAATWAFWHGEEHPLLRIQQERAPKKIGRNEPCPCGSGKKYKRCCGVAA
jgi:uncharacterized protein